MRKPSPPDAVILCVGLGARFLGGIEDKDVIPVRGQTVLLRAPWVRTMPVLKDLKDGAMPPYVIPRKGGDVSVFQSQVQKISFLIYYRSSSEEPITLTTGSSLFC